MISMKNVKVFLIFLLVLTAALISVSMADYSGEITLWVSEEAIEVTEELISQFKADYPEYSGMTVNIEGISENEAADIILSGNGIADIFSFAQDQTARLISTGVLRPVSGYYASTVADENSSGAVAAAQRNEHAYTQQDGNDTA